MGAKRASKGCPRGSEIELQKLQEGSLKRSQSPLGALLEGSKGEKDATAPTGCCDEADKERQEAAKKRSGASLRRGKGRGKTLPRIGVWVD